jgi:hypothetical protein
MDFLELYDWCDVIQSREFEHVDLNYTYTDDQLSEVNHTVLATLCLPMADPVLCQQMYVSKAIRTFIDRVDYIVNSGEYNRSDENNLRYYIQSAHDWTVAQHLLFWDAVNGNFTVLPFSS